MERKPIWMAISIIAIWAAVAVIGIFGPSYETAEIAIPLSAILAPIFGAIATGFLAMWAVSA